MTGADLSFTIIVVAFFVCFAAVRIVRIITGNWKNMS
jgi:hypothetical protein